MLDNIIYNELSVFAVYEEQIFSEWEMANSGFNRAFGSEGGGLMKSFGDRLKERVMLGISDAELAMLQKNEAATRDLKILRRKTMMTDNNNAMEEFQRGIEFQHGFLHLIWSKITGQKYFMQVTDTERIESIANFDMQTLIKILEQ